MAQAEKAQNKPRNNPIIWVSIIVIGLIVFIFAGSDRGTVKSKKIVLEPEPQLELVTQPEPELITRLEIKIEPEPVSVQEPISMQELVQGQINRPSPPSPGLQARQFIGQIRQQGKPFPFDQLMAQASAFANEGSLADAHLTFFFAAREGHIEAMMMMAEMSDPTLFRPENNLLDKADAVQAYKWYTLAVDDGFEPAESRLENLHRWARAEAKFGDASARQLLLNFR